LECLPPYVGRRTTSLPRASDNCEKKAGIATSAMSGGAIA